MMDFGIVEAEIAEMLITKLESEEDLIIEAIGENDADYDLPFGKRKVIIAFSNEEAVPTSNSFDVVNQDVSIVFSVLLQSKTVRGTKGIYQLANHIKTHLIGFIPTDGEAFRYAAMRFEQKTKNFFEYSLDFKTRGIAIQQYVDLEEQSGPLLKEVKFNC